MKRIFILTISALLFFCSVDAQKRVIDAIDHSPIAAASIFDASGNAKEDEIDYILDNFDGDKILWEAPNKDQQVFFILKLGNAVNLGNVSSDDITSLETLRQGLRGDTVGKIN